MTEPWHGDSTSLAGDRLPVLAREGRARVLWRVECPDCIDPRRTAAALYAVDGDERAWLWVAATKTQRGKAPRRAAPFHASERQRVEMTACPRCRRGCLLIAVGDEVTPRWTEPPTFARVADE